MPTRWSGAEARLLYKTRQEDMTEALGAFEQSDVPAIKTLEDAKLFDTTTKEGAWAAMNKSVDTTWTYVLSWMNKDWAKNNRVATMDDTVEAIAKERMEATSLQLQKSKDRKTRELEALYRDHGFSLDLASVKVLVIKELLDGIAVERKRLEERVNKYSKLQHLIDALKNQVNPQEKVLSTQEDILQELLTKTENTLKDKEDEEKQGRDEAVQNDVLLRGTMTNALDLNDPSAMEILYNLDKAILDNVLGKSGPIERLIAQFARQPNVRKEDVDLVIQAAGFMKNNNGYVRLYREKNWVDNEDPKRLDLDMIMKTITARPVGSIVTLRDKQHVILKQDTERNAVITRIPGSTKTYVIDPTPVADASGTMKYRALLKDSDGTTKWIKIGENTPPTP